MCRVGLTYASRLAAPRGWPRVKARVLVEGQGIIAIASDERYVKDVK
jgi:hypothetical protein